jgi:hypothetical protein
MGVERLGCEANHSPPFGAQIKNGGATPPLPAMTSWHGAYLIKQTDNFTCLSVVQPQFMCFSGTVTYLQDNIKVGGYYIGSSCMKLIQGIFL